MVCVLRSTARKFKRADGARKQKLPSKDDVPMYGVKSKKNFVVANAVDNILAVPPARTRKQAPDWTKKSDYGANLLWWFVW